MRDTGFLAALAFAVIAGATPAWAGLDFDFSFSNTGGIIPGTVTGEVFGLTDDTTSAAADVVIDSYPALFSGLPLVPWDIFKDEALLINENSFTVAGGVITGADFYEDGAGDIFSLNYLGNSGLQGPSGNSTVNGNGFAGITFTPVSTQASVPEPPTLVMIGAGLLALLGFGALHRRTTNT